MIVLLSPSKTLNTETVKENSLASSLPNTQPQFLEHSENLAAELKGMSAEEIAEMMKVSEKIATLNYERYQNWHTPFTEENSKQALLSFQGDVYRDIDTENYSKEDFEFAQKTIRTISGLYGILRPLDLMQPYRLEMKFRDKYWKEILTKHLEKYLKENPQPIVNLASNEYSSAIDLKKLAMEGQEIITPSFKENKNGKYKTIALYSKIARGTMTNWIVKNRIENPNELKKFKEDGYKFAPDLSTENQLTFTRN